MTCAVRGPAPNTTWVALLYKSQPRHSSAAAPNVRTLVVLGTNGAALLSMSTNGAFFSPCRGRKGPAHGCRAALYGPPGVRCAWMQDLSLILTLAAGLGSALV